ncbi:MAG: hypothetical protein BGN92_09125 [Sphingobacteriales bacterium 41-5]|nr:MAG: hypothetical protein BGN92_09125 [Sphingobacteriales bacterium 41-5]
MHRKFLIFGLLISTFFAEAQTIPEPQARDTTHLPVPVPVVTFVDTTLRILNLNPYFSLHVDSSLSYRLLINRPQKNYYWYLKNAPAGLMIDKDNGTLSFKSNKNIFRSGRLKYDTEYPVHIGLQSLVNPNDKVDTTFSITWYNTDVVVPRVKPSVVSPVTVEEGYKLSFNVMCEDGNFPIDKILFSSSQTISNYKLPKSCDDSFEWVPPYDFVTDADKAKEKTIDLFFIGTTKFNFSDTARVRVIVKESLNYDIATGEFKDVNERLTKWILDLKYTFLQLDKRVKKTKSTRSAFDITTATSTVTGTIFATTANKDKTVNDWKADAGKIMPSAGVVLIPVKEAAAPQKTAEQNQASLVRSTIKRLEYVQFDNKLSGEKDPNIAAKTENLKKELRQSQIQLAEVPTDIANNMSAEELNRYFDSPKVQKKYRLK